MGTTLKSLIPQSTKASSQTVALAASFLDFSSTASLEQIRQLSQFLPVIVLLPKCAMEDQNHSRRIIASEFTASTAEKSFELLQTTPRQPEKPDSADESAFGDVRINFAEMTASVKEQPVALTTMEFKALKYMMQNARRVISRDELLNEVWGYENYPNTRTVDNHILRLRRKLEREPSEPRHFITIHRTGYKFMP
jgi:DNA-binding response OmpR family regulator